MTGAALRSPPPLHDELPRLMPGLLKRLSSFQAPVEVVFIDRVVGGHCGTLRELRARGRFLELVRPDLDRIDAAPQP
jgi:hypothetical protein